jgi:hypothetical protein
MSRYALSQLVVLRSMCFELCTFHFELEVVPVRGFDTLRNPELAGGLAFSGTVRLAA